MKLKFVTCEIAKVTQRTCVPERELAGDAVDGDDEPESEHLLRERWSMYSEFCTNYSYVKIHQ